MKAHWVLYFAVSLSSAVLGSVLTLALFDSTEARLSPSSNVEGAAVVPTALHHENEGNVQFAADRGIDADVLEDLQQQSANAVLERAQLADSVALLNRQLESLESDLVNQDARMQQQSLVTNMDGGDLEGQHSERGFRNSNRETSAQDRIDSLLAAGVDSQMATELQARQDQFQLSRLELFDQAQREGWIDSDDFSDRLEELEDQQVDLRAELGDAAYDRYLYELGRSNRVIVSSVISGSAAQGAGLQSGDMIITYANERIFSINDLQSATRAGLRGEYVLVNFERNGQLQGTEMPRGPLGVTLSMSRREPS